MESRGARPKFLRSDVSMTSLWHQKKGKKFLDKLL